MVNKAMVSRGDDLPKRIGRFEIERVLGEGAQGVVYLGRDPELERDVAIKSLHLDSHDRDPGLMETLRQEARTMGKMQHPNIVAIHDAGVHAGRPYLVFEFVEGMTLSDLRTDEDLSVKRATAIMRDIISGMAFAHQRDVIHCDLKPANILIGTDDKAKITDFGIAKIISGNRREDGNLIGSPRYMAPEYIQHGIQGAASDVSSLGLIFHEVLTGRVATSGRKLPDIFKQITEGQIEPPSRHNAQVDEKLDAIVLRALVKDPAERYTNAQVLHQALEDYGSTAKLAVISGGEDDKKTTIAFLVRRMRHKSEFPALSSAIRELNHLVVNDRQSIAKLSTTILKDFALTNKILRTVNSAFFRRGSGKISTISRAVVILGLQTVRNIASSMLLFEHLQDNQTKSRLNDHMLTSMFSGVLAGEIASGAKNGRREEAFLCATFHNLGRLLTTYYFSEESTEIERLREQRNLTWQQASTVVLGVSFEELGIAIAKEWDFPDSLIDSMRGLPQDTVPAVINPKQFLRYLSSFANEVSTIIGEGGSPKARQQRMEDAATRYRDAIDLDPESLVSTLKQAGDEFASFTSMVEGKTQASAFNAQLQGVTSQAEEGGETAVMPLNGDSTQRLVGDPEVDDNGNLSILDQTCVTESPDMAQQILAAGIQDISNALVGDYSLNDIFHIAVETMYRGLHFTRVILCLKDPKRSLMNARIGLGSDIDAILAKFTFPLKFAPDAFHLALKKDVDVLIQDASAAKIRSRLPGWYRNLIHARSFVVFPIIIKRSPLAMFYADYDHAKQTTIEDSELSLLKTLRNQTTLAIKQQLF